MADLSIIRTNGQLLALQNLPGLSRIIQLVSLGELQSAPDMYQRLHTLVRIRQWTCEKLVVLEGLSWLARSLQRLRGLLQDLQPAANPNAALQGPNSILHEIARIKYQACQLRRAKSEIKFRVGGLASQCGKLGTLLFDESNQVLSGTMTIADFQARIPVHFVEINNLLLSGMQF